MIKTYTDLEQSERLSKILPIESADMFYTIIDQGLYLEVKQGIEPSKDDIPCWSLAALIKLLPSIYTLKPMIDLEENSIYYSGHNTLYTNGDTLIDACINMIFKLNEQNLI